MAWNFTEKFKLYPSSHAKIRKKILVMVILITTYENYENEES